MTACGKPETGSNLYSTESAVSAPRTAVIVQSSAPPVGAFSKSPLNKMLESGAIAPAPSQGRKPRLQPRLRPSAACAAGRGTGRPARHRQTSAPAAIPTLLRPVPSPPLPRGGESTLVPRAGRPPDAAAPPPRSAPGDLQLLRPPGRSPAPSSAPWRNTV